MKVKIEIKNRFTGKVLFEIETENNSVKNTLLEAINSGADLYGADLSGADLSRANLYGANLSGANLSGANLYGANLSGANLSVADLSGAYLSRADLSGANLYGAYLSGAYLSRADLSGADLSGADLSGADLSGADLSGALNKEDSHLPLFCKWSFSIKGSLIRIGCKEKNIKDWDLFFNSNEVYETQRDSVEFKQIEAVYVACKSYLNHLSR